MVVPTEALLTMFNMLLTDYQMDTVGHLVIVGVMLDLLEIM